MRIPVLFWRACAVLALLGAGGFAPAAAASTPPLIWQGVARIRILCLVKTGAGVDTGPLRDRICGRVAALARDGAPAPVSIVEPGDPSVLAADSITLLVHANVEPSAAGPLLALSVRPYRASDAGALLFAAPPRAVPLADAGALESALRATLSETLPWRARPAGPQAINNN